MNLFGVKMGTTTELRINLGALKRQDPYIEKIVDTSTHVAVYSFSPQLNEWEKTEVEGALFVYSRVAPPYWGFTIFNRLSMDNLTEPLTLELEFQTQNPFLLYRNAKLLIYGIWFYDQEDCKRIGNLLEKLCLESSSRVPDNRNAQKIELFGGGDGIVQAKGPTPKFGSPTSNSANSISPGSSVGGANRPTSNGEAADSESDEKEIANSNKGSINILDLLSKAQDKYEKEKRNTPDPGIENMQSGTEQSLTEVEMQLVKPVAVKPSHPQKLDVAALFKQPAKPPDVNAAALAGKGQTNSISNTTQFLSMSAMNPQQAGMAAQSVPQPTMTQPTANAAMPQQRRVQLRPMGRSYSMNEVAMRQHIDTYMGGNVMSVEEIEAGLSRSSAASRQQQVNSTLDRMIDRINSSAGGLSANGTGLAQPIPMPGIQEAGQKFTTGGAPAGNIGRMSSVRGAPPTFMKPHGDSRQRSMSSSAMSPSKPIRIVASNALPPKAHFTPNFSSLQPNIPLHTPVLPKATAVQISTVPPSYQPHNAAQQSLLHGNVVTTKPVTYSAPNVLASITAAASSISIKDQVPKAAATLPQGSTSSPALPTTLLSPEDFQLSTVMQPKKADLKQMMLHEATQDHQTLPKRPAIIPTPLTKEQLRQTLVSLLQKDSPFLTAIHEAYMTNFNHT